MDENIIAQQQLELMRKQLQFLLEDGERLEEISDDEFTDAILNYRDNIDAVFNQWKPILITLAAGSSATAAATAGISFSPLGSLFGGAFGAAIGAGTVMYMILCLQKHAKSIINPVVRADGILTLNPRPMKERIKEIFRNVEPHGFLTETKKVSKKDIDGVKSFFSIFLKTVTLSTGISEAEVTRAIANTLDQTLRNLPDEFVFTDFSMRQETQSLEINRRKTRT